MHHCDRWRKQNLNEKEQNGWTKSVTRMVKVFDIQLYRHPHKFHTPHLLFSMRSTFNESDSFFKRTLIAAAAAAGGAVVVVDDDFVVIVIIVALQLTQFRAKLHKLWSFESVVFINCRIHYTRVIFSMFAIQKGVHDFQRFRLQTQKQKQKHSVSEAYGIVILSSAINQHRLVAAATVTNVENHSHHNQSFRIRCASILGMQK